MSPFHAAARRYALAGIPIFPCLPGSKSPACPHGFHDATTDLAQIDAWWTEEPANNPAFTPHSMGWGVVDIDSAQAQEAWNREADKEPDIEPTWEVRTPRGGAHLYYRGELPTSVRRIMPGEAIDTRGRGSYALLPPSQTKHGVYTVAVDAEVAPLPAWVTRAIRDTDRGGAITASDVELDLPANVDRAIAFLKDAKVAIAHESGNERTFVVAATLHDLGLSVEKALELVEPWNERCDPPWEDAELERIVANAYRYAENSPGIHSTVSAREAFGPILHTLLERPADQEAEPSRGRFYPEDEDEQEQGKDPTWLIPDLVPDEATVMIYGPTQSYKSFVAVEIALSVAAGIPSFAGAPARSGCVFYAALEGRTNLKKSRRRAWKLARGVDKVPNFYTMPAPLLILPEEVEAFVEAVTARLDGRPCAGIVLDTLAKVMSGMNENDAKDAGQFIRFADHLKETFRCPVYFIHHTGRDASHDRGSTAFRAGADTVIKVDADRHTRMMTVKVEKHKDAEEREEPWYLEGKLVGTSLAFQPVSKAEYDAATKAHSLYAHKKIGGALKTLGAIGEDHAVTSYVLASALAQAVEGEDHESRDKKVASIARTLAKLAKDSLEAYAVTSGREVAWFLPSAT